MSKRRRPAPAASPQPIPASHCRPGDLVRHDGREFVLAILTDTTWICRLATESRGAPPMHYVPLSAEVVLVKAYQPEASDAGAEVDPLLGGAS